MAQRDFVAETMELNRELNLMVEEQKLNLTFVTYSLYPRQINHHIGGT